LNWALSAPGVPFETTQKIYLRYLSFVPDAAEDYIDFLLQNGKLDEAARKFMDILNDEYFISKRGHT
jgi:hypothetical protein